MTTKAKSSKKSSIPDPPMDQLEIGNAIYQTTLTSKFKNRKNWQRPEVRMVDAVIPGTIQKIMVKEGDVVTQGTPMLILEAMKMRNEIIAPIEGTIKKIHVSVGIRIPKGHLLIEFA
jgi:biotin carboxyl carrier protein